MATLITKNSSTASAVPAAGDLVKGELAVNVTDKKVYTKDNSAAVVKLVGSLGNQEANAVAITGGAINGTTIGATTPSTGAFTTASASGGFTGNLTGNVTGNVSGTAANVTGVVAIANGGTGLSSLGTGVQSALGQAVTGSGSFVLSTSPSLTTPNLGTPSAAVLTNATGLPLTTGVTGTLGVANGGTGITAFGTGVATALGQNVTGSGGIVLATSPSLTTPNLGTPSAATLTNATGLPISTGVSGLGTGVATALAVNTGSAGAFVVNGGALGTPSSGTVTNLTGTASININGTVGATTPTTGAFTTLSASGNITVSGGTANGVAYLNGSKVLTTGSALSFDGNFLVAAGASARMQVAPSTTTNLALFQSTNTGGSAYFGLDSSTGGLSGTAYALNIYHNSNYPIIFSLNSAEQMRLTSTGLGIGTSSPQKKLVVSNAGAAGMEWSPTDYAGNMRQLAYNRSTSAYVALRTEASQHEWYIGGSESMRLDSSGNLGIGTSSPLEKLDVVSTVQSRIRVRSTTANEAVLYLQNSNTGTSLSDGFYVGITGANDAYLWNYENNPVIFGTNNTERARITSGGDLLVGCTALPSASVKGSAFLGDANQGRLYVSANNTGARDLAYWINPNGVVGTITTTGTATAYNTSSDYRLKNITGPVTNSGAYIDSLKPVEGTWKADGSTFVGLLAHEAQEVSRTTVATGTKDGEQMQGMDYSNSEFIANIIAELQSLRARVAQLEAK